MYNYCAQLKPDSQLHTAIRDVAKEAVSYLPKDSVYDVRSYDFECPS